MGRTEIFVFICVTVCFNSVAGRYIPVLIKNPYKTPRQDFIGSWIQSSEWFPIEINVPDTISNVGQGISSVGQGIATGLTNFGNGFGDFLQRIPIINGIISQFRPRPFKFYILMPVENNNQQPISGGESVQFNPFDNAVSSFIPTYP